MHVSIVNALLCLCRVDKFEESKENKLEYTEVFNTYTTFVESSIEKYLSSKIPVGATMVWNSLLCYVLYACVYIIYSRCAFLCANSTQGFNMKKFERLVAERQGTVQSPCFLRALDPACSFVPKLTYSTRCF